MNDLIDIIGKTPLVRINSLSQISGQNIYAKLEFLNPGGSIKDRTALGIVRDALESGKLRPGMEVIEGTAGNTGIGLALVCRQYNLQCTIVMPNNQSQEKYTILKALGVNLITVDPCPFSSEKHFYHQARILHQENPNSFWANQFENLSNFNIHYATTGAEIWNQTQGQVDAFISAAGTGGTIGGVSCYLKEKNPLVHIHLADPFGSGLYHYFYHQEFKSTGSSMTEGIGIMRATENFKKAKIDSASQISDQQMIDILYHLARHDGLLVGTSAALNIAAAFEFAKNLTEKNKIIVTIVCDGALRYQDKVFNLNFLKDKGLTVKWALDTP
jgi:cysteine synthase